MSPSRRITAKYPGFCRCGAEIEEGDEVAWDPAVQRVTGCLGCDWTGVAPPARVDMSNIRGGGRGVAAALRRREEKRARARARENR